MLQKTAVPITERELAIERYIDSPPEKLFRCWTEPDLLKQWFCPRPWIVTSATLDVRPGGGNFIVMHGPEGEEFPNRGVYLDIVPNRRLVFTDAFVDAWTPSEKPFMTGIITFEPRGKGTRYVARALHWTVADRIEHEKMGFHEGWGTCTDQLAELVVTLPG